MKNHLQTSAELPSRGVPPLKLSQTLEQTPKSNKQTLLGRVSAYTTHFTRNPAWKCVKIAF